MRSIAYFLLFTVLAAPVAAAPITYQGQLQKQDQPFNGKADLEFRLFDSVGGPTQIGPVQTRDEVSVPGGVFQVELDFGVGAFDGSARFLEVRVNGTSLTPRQAVTATPQALHARYARDAGNLDGEAADAFMRRTGPESLTANSTTAALTVEQTGTSSGLEASTLSTAEGRAAVKGVAGDSAFSANSPAGVFGTSASYRGVVGSSSTSDGMLGFSQSGIGVHGQSLSGPGVRGVSSSGLAIEAIGNADVTGDLNVNGRLDVGDDASLAGDLTVTGSIQNSMMPIAMAWIWEDTLIYATSGNVSVIWNATFNQYEVTIAGENYNWTDYVTIISPATAGRTYRILSTGSPGRMVVQFTDLSGNPAQSHFQFITYKP